LNEIEKKDFFQDPRPFYSIGIRVIFSTCFPGIGFDTEKIGKIYLEKIGL
jgi:hypothetical protein